MSSSAIIDGEASETDDESEGTSNQPRDNLREAPIVQISPKNSKNKVPDRKSEEEIRLEKRWTQLGADLINTTRRRTQPQEKVIMRMTELAADCFSSMQNVAAKLNVVHTNVTRLEDSVADLVEACHLIPDTFSLKYSEINIPKLS